MSWKITCSKCKRDINCCEKSFMSRMKKYKDEEDFRNNYLCRLCKPKKAKKVKEENNESQ